MAVTLAQVAAHAGVSPQTVSNAISNPSIVKSSTLRRVEASIATLGYTPNLRARMLRQQRTGSIGLRIRPVDDNVAAVLTDRLLHELSAQAAEDSKHVLLFTATSDAQEVETISRLRAQGLVDEFVLTDTHPDDARIPALTEQDASFVSFGRPWDDRDATHSWVDVDGRAGVAQATGALLDLGYRRIAFLGWPRGSATGDDRRAGWETTLKERLGLSDADLESWTFTSEEQISEAIDAGPAVVAAGADAVVCVSDSLAVGMVAAVRTAGLAIPIVGFDNTPLAASLGFSSVDQDLGRIAHELLRALTTTHEPVTALVTPRLVIRHDPRWGFPTAPTGPGPKKGNLS
ncbi:hypothetical protein BW730_17130 [Tessaracoccus aquimaris]|uniref:HTH lacI-type domain-containing protein n=1 Tax=Tessaracoccus aquimaris TaxID=1332264 RepID=A0A1Q2CS76_9ACTN|nr:LacI family DNA-binding transcriptional regulator [Tessaracoccus aquimaris]AQP48964.1 hypothetical protein BW730_17130 [Tessaracoccus aquimaris]